MNHQFQIVIFKVLNQVVTYILSRFLSHRSSVSKTFKHSFTGLLYVHTSHCVIHSCIISLMAGAIILHFYSLFYKSIKIMKCYFQQAVSQRTHDKSLMLYAKLNMKEYKLVKAHFGALNISTYPRDQLFVKNANSNAKLWPL